MNVWIVVWRDYDNFGIDTVWTSKDAAVERLRELDRADTSVSGASDYCIELWPADTGGSSTEKDIEVADVRTPEDVERREKLRAEQVRAQYIADAGRIQVVVSWPNPTDLSTGA